MHRAGPCARSGKDTTMVKKIIYTWLFVLVGIVGVGLEGAYAQQGGRKNYSNQETTREYRWGLNTNTNSGIIGGFNFIYGRYKGERLFETFGLEVVNVKHPQELRYNHNLGGSFIFGKQNYLFAVRGSYGYEALLFKQAPQQGVQVSLIFNGGPTLGVVAPYYIDYVSNTSSTQTVPYDPNIHNFNGIIGSPGIFRGLGESSIVPGVHARGGISFEFGSFKDSATGFELGAMLEAYTQEIIIVPGARNRSIYPSAYVTLFHKGLK